MNFNEQPLAFRIKSLNNQIRRLMESSAMIENDAELTGMQYAFIGFLATHNGKRNIYQRDIEAEFNIRRSTASGMLKLMEKNGYIKRVTDPDDTRMKIIIMTEKARELNKVAVDNMLQIQKRLMKDIPKEEMESFYKTMDKISENAQE